MKRTLSLVLIAFSFAHTLGDEPMVQKNISYLEPNRPEKADLYTPSGNHTAPLPAVLLIHGGGWGGGDKADKQGVNIATEVARMGYVVLAINYQLSHWEGNPKYGVPLVFKPGWPQNLYDCKSALRFMRKQAAQLGIDPNHIATMGESAGAHLAMLLGATARVDDLNQGGLYTDQSNDVSCIVDLYGPPDLSAPERKVQVGNFAGKTDAETAENIRRASPITYFNAQTPPILILHGTTDVIVPVEASRHLADLLKQLGVPYQYVEVPKMWHGFTLEPAQLDRSNPQSMTLDLRPVVLDFLKKYLGNPVATP